MLDKVLRLIKQLDKFKPVDLFFGGITLILVYGLPIYYFIKWSNSLG